MSGNAEHRIDSECEVAAIAFGSRDAPDELLEEFAADLAATGVVVAGAIQRGRCADRAGLACKLLPSGDLIELTQNLGSGSQACSLDVSRLIEAGAALEPDHLPPDTGLVIINRFGKLEEHGGGLRDHITGIALKGIPLIIAVAESRFDAWNRYAGGLSVKLPCERAAVDNWWSALAGGRPYRPSGKSNFTCRDWK